MFDKNWKDLSFVAFDLETTGAYPLGAEICEIGAVKWKGGQEVGSFHSLIKPKKPMPNEVIAIHGITDAMVAGSPRISEKIKEFYDFIGDSIAVAHHAPFDMGFLAIEFEKAGLKLPEDPVMCSSLLARQVIHESPNHKLQTLIEVLDLPRGEAHRALDDARACLHLMIKICQRVGEDATFEQIYANQKHHLFWSHFSVKEWFTDQRWSPIMDALDRECEVEILYQSKNAKAPTWRRIHPFGAVRNPDGDWLSAFCLKDSARKRYYMSSIHQSRAVN